MSVLVSLACSHYLPEGIFGQIPKAVYSTYKAYKKSKDYIFPSERSDESKYLDFGPVVVYENHHDSKV